MSNPYPSRRELRLQREREERAQLRDDEAQRWAEEVEDRQQRAAGAERQASETLAKVEPVPASETSEVPLEPAQFDQQQDDNVAGRRAANSPVDAPADVDEPVEDTLAPRRRRRADSQVTSTGMLPLITKRRDGSEEPKSEPRSRREARHHAQLVSAERQAEIDDLKAQQEKQQQAVPPKAVRRATAPQAPPPPVPAVEASAAPDEPLDNEADAEASEDTVVLSTWERYGESAVEITDMSGLDTLEIRRAELRDETAKLTQEIIELGQENPNVIDPLLLRRQKELAETSQELQDLETAAIEIVQEQETDQQDTESGGALEADTEADVPVDDVIPEEVVESDDDDAKPSRRARRASTGPLITGPFEVTDEDESVAAATAETKPDFAEHFEPHPETDAMPITGPEQPLEASSAHGLDTLDPKESEAPERRILTISIAVFAVGIIALIIALILLTR